MSRLLVIVPTLGTSPALAAAITALAAPRPAGLELRIVHQGDAELPPAAAQADRVIGAASRLGFAAAVHRGLEPLDAEYVALVNDDAIVAPQWCELLVAALDADPAAAAAQGINLDAASPAVLDGRGIGWNRWWQAVQLGHGDPPPAVEQPVREVFGVSATAAVFRSAALTATGPRPFDEELDSYYEDVELACRLRGRGWRSLVVPAARCTHFGSLTGQTLGPLRFSLLYGNRLLVLGRLLGSAWWPRLPAMLAADLRDLWRGDRERRRGILEGWRRARRLAPRWVRSGPPLVPLADLRRFRE